MPPKKEFLCIMPDKSNVLELRKKLAGYITIRYGAILESHAAAHNDVQIKGSMVVYTGESAEEVLSLIQKDVYATSGVWDLEKVQIWPRSLEGIGVDVGCYLVCSCCEAAG
ncbi:hypothetical protein ABOM_011807 [Aspergillus bombycis]|uniref:YCII-related domain-containing protein n=1 Tax=Aspergillus bombycis TaxID=109264 RepID=A0A1F7ZIV7_9EURO|nr:hypothetical protein ABOM_011807 [Aspergillus bombycis]OGM39386.1 hypothetical protein ABOM_011807 [Aspergillus bombycis]